MIALTEALRSRTFDPEFGSEEAQVLCAAVSALPVIPLSTLRAARRRLFPDSAPVIEWEAAEGFGVAGLVRDGLCLETDWRLALVEVLRDVARAEDLRSDLEALRELHQSAARSLSALLAVESDLIWSYILSEDSELSGIVEDTLRDVLLSAVVEDRDGILDWAAAAQRRLPEQCMTGGSAWLIAQLNSPRGLQMRPVPVPQFQSGWGILRLASHRLPTAVMGIARRDNRLVLGPPSRLRTAGVSVVATDPFVLRLTERRDGRQVRRRVLRIPRGREIDVELDSSNECTLENLAGQTFTLPPFTSGESPEIQAARRAIEAAESVRASGSVVVGTVVREVDAAYIVALEEVGVTAWLASPIRPLTVGEEVPVFVDRIAENNRWVSARVAGVRVLDGAAGTGILHIPNGAMPSGVRAGDIYPARMFRHGEDRGGSRSAHVYVDPISPLGRVSYSHRTGYLRFPDAVREVDGGWWPALGDAMEVHVAGRIADVWELRLRPAPPTRVLESGGVERDDILEATVLSVSPAGANVELESGQRGWLAASHMVERGSQTPRRVDRGSVLRVRVLGYPPKRSVQVSERAATAPYLRRVRSGRRVRGQTVDLGRGRIGILLDPIRRVSGEPFIAQAADESELDGLSVGDRIVGIAGSVRRMAWILEVEDVQRDR